MPSGSTSTTEVDARLVQRSLQIRHDRPYGLGGQQDGAVSKIVERLKFRSGHLGDDLLGATERNIDIIPRVDDEGAAAARLQELHGGEGTKRPTSDPLKAMLEGAAHRRIEIPMAGEM